MYVDKFLNVISLGRKNGPGCLLFLAHIPCMSSIICSPAAHICMHVIDNHLAVRMKNTLVEQNIHTYSPYR